ncbi:MAG: hypothetical protein WA581_04660 [Candidatus Acidiferrales bacterium]
MGSIIRASGTFIGKAVMYGSKPYSITRLAICIVFTPFFGRKATSCMNGKE